MPEDQTSPVEKRVADLEIVIGEMEERFEDLEDLIALEQVGIVELQKVVEEAKGISMEAPTAIGADVEERLKGLETEVASTLGRKPEGPLGSTDTRKVYQKIDELEKKIANTKKSTEELREILKGKVRLEMEGADYKDMPSRIGKIEEKTKLLEEDLRKGMLQKFSGMAKERDLATLRIKTDSIEKLVKDLEGRMEKLREVEGGIRKPAEVDKLVEKVEEANKILSTKVSSEMNVLNEKIRSLEEKGTMPKEMEKLKEKIKLMDSSFEDKYRKDMEGLKSTITKIIKESKAPSAMDTQINELLEKIVFLEKRLDSLEKGVRKATESKPWTLE